MSTSTPVTQGAHHVGLTVPDLQATTTFFIETLGFNQVGEVPDYPARFVSDGHILITLWQASDPESARAFDRHNAIGLHHFALRVPGQAELDALHDTLSREAGVAIEFAPELLGGGPSRHMMCRIPGGIRRDGRGRF